MTLIAMAGLAEAELALLEVLAGAVVLVSAALVALGWWRKWVGVAGLGWSICLIAGMMIQPWNVFHGPENPKDSDEVFWIRQWRVTSVVWAGAFAAELYCVRIIMRRRLPVDSVGTGA